MGQGRCLVLPVPASSDTRTSPFGARMGWFLPGVDHQDAKAVGSLDAPLNRKGPLGSR
jgi:hypothetical protein